MSQHKLSPAVSVLAGFTLLIVAVATASEPAGTPEGFTRTTPPTTIDQETRDHFGILRRARSTEDNVAMGESSGRMVAEHGIALDHARRLVTGPRGSRAWIAPSANGFCLLVRTPGDRGPGGGCGTGREVFSQGAIFSLSHGDGTTELFGLAPDGVGSVEVQFDNGASQSVPVKENGYYVSSSRSLTKVSFNGPAGPVSINASSGD